MNAVPPALRERIARAVHEEYLRYCQRRGISADRTAALCGWDDLPPDLKDANRAQAEDIVRKLQRIGCRIEPLRSSSDGPRELSPEEVERLAKREHSRWARERIQAGWSYARESDYQRKEHSCLVPWEDLSEEERDKDRNAVRRIPEILYAAGLAVRRQE